jgi:fungal nitric oxide reductase
MLILIKCCSILCCTALYCIVLKQGVITFLEHGDQLKEMMNDDTLIISAVEELLRFHTASALATKRVAQEDVTISGVVSNITTNEQ